MTDNPADTLSAEDNARIASMCAIFTRIGEERMKDLALYNGALQVEAACFRRWEGWLAGILVTPWFMNLMLLPLDGDRLAGKEAGAKEKLELPSGELVFTTGEIEEIGKYFARSLHSPMGNFPNHALAVLTAHTEARRLFSPPEETAQAAGGCGA